ncbi:MAG: L,D-transpeptidase [Gammaproteobacteria bacterium]|nr:L,D-transpeptidase [Gammaproteobacteria bacterium]
MLSGLFLLLSLPASANEATGTWIEIDTASSTLELRQSDNLVLRLDDISIGRGGTSAGDRQRGDGTTPLGEFRVVEVDGESRYESFILLNYPTVSYARIGFARDQISSSTYEAIFKAHLNGQLPPQNTVLGGHIGIHGLGLGDPEIHENFNWTEGCVALTNEQLRQLLPHVRPGLRVIIR